MTLSKMVAYSYQSVRNHLCIVRLGGVIWDVSETGGVAPNLVFEKSLHGDCMKSMSSVEGQQMKIEEKLSCCWQIAKALDETHRARE